MILQIASKFIVSLILWFAEKNMQWFFAEAICADFFLGHTMSMTQHFFFIYFMSQVCQVTKVFIPSTWLQPNIFPKGYAKVYKAAE